MSHISQFSSFLSRLLYVYEQSAVLRNELSQRLLQKLRGNLLSCLFSDLDCSSVSCSTSTSCWCSTSSSESKYLWVPLIWRVSPCLEENDLSHIEHFIAIVLVLFDFLQVAMDSFVGSSLTSVEAVCLCVFVMCTFRARVHLNAIEHTVQYDVALALLRLDWTHSSVLMFSSRSAILTQMHQIFHLQLTPFHKQHHRCTLVPHTQQTPHFQQTQFHCQHWPCILFSTRALDFSLTTDSMSVASYVSWPATSLNAVSSECILFQPIFTTNCNLC